MRELLSEWLPRLLKPGQTQQRVDDSERCLELFKRDKKDFLLLFHRDNAPDLALSDYWLFADIKKMLQGKKFGSNEEVNVETEACFLRAKTNRSNKKAWKC
ncbi:hypothetical protein WN51_11127 [Melipona quadrifasciata]|uniref:Histone-lysine N-methyltransferase SETMAR n=1 Tax=Melipona quadrifasciata TaxID=166423 RepID=A0A0M9A413_9HYME|nr:hypothetical protein WN51_11127 [Melipona quadrifasciata]